VALIFSGEHFSGKNMAEVGSTAVAQDFGSLSIAIGSPFDGALYLVIKAGPAAA
jgi:hypothetical protein